MCDPVTATYVTLAVTGATTMMSIQAQKASMKMQQQQAEFQRKQFKMQADAAELETVQVENDRKRKYTCCGRIYINRSSSRCRNKLYIPIIVLYVSS